MRTYDYVIIGAGSLLTEGFKAPKGSLIFGRPGKVIRQLTDKELAHLKWSANHYVQLARSYRGGPWPYPGMQVYPRGR